MAVFTAVIAGSVPAAVAQQAAAVSPARVTAKQIEVIENGNALLRGAFYDTADPFPRGEPGDLIRSEECSEYRFPFVPPLPPGATGIKVVRFLYHSRAVNDGDVPASGVIVLPYGQPPSGGWPVVVWAHGTSGVGRQFAPSLMKDLYYSWASPLAWAALGYAVVAPDYAGLGSNVLHQYLAVRAQASDTIYAVPAARRAVPELSGFWIAVGHSQGAGAVLGVAEMQHSIRDPKYLGAIALAPAGDLEPTLEHIHQTDTRGFIGLLAWGMKSVYPDFNYGDFLTPPAAALMPQITEHGLALTLANFSEKTLVGEVARPDWKSNRTFQTFRQENMLGNKPAAGPILLIHGEQDELIPVSVTDALCGRMKAQGSAVEYRTFPGLNHDAVVFGCFRNQVEWARTRFNSKLAPDIIPPN